MPVDDEILRLMVKQLHEALATNQTIVSSLQQEMAQNREVRAVFRANLDTINEAVQALQRVIDGTDTRDSLAVTLVKIQTQLDDLKEQMIEIEAERAEDVKKQEESRKTWQERMWLLLMQNSPGILAALGALAYSVLKGYFTGQ